MRTKVLLCAAALAAGAISTMAQSNVYSLNIVGYVNVDMPAGNFIYVNPLSGGVSNGASEIMPSLPDGTLINLWGGSSFTGYYYDTSLGISPNNWYQADGVTPGNPPSLPPGLGFFMSPGNHFTNTFVGQVTPGPGTTNTANYSAGNSLVGSRLPASGAVTNSGNGQFNLPLVDGMLLNKWTGSAYVGYYFDSTLGISPDGWYLSDGVTPGPVPSFNIGQGFFWNPGGAAAWSQSLAP
jgi:hypothetical protein